VGKNRERPDCTVSIPFPVCSIFSNICNRDGKNNPVIRENLTGNPYAQWEEADQWNIGMDLSFLNQRLNFTIDYFNNLRTKILIPSDLFNSLFYRDIRDTPDINLGEVRNRGFDFSLN
jgi:outer membrane receptor protein involved in Fe transport